MNCQKGDIARIVPEHPRDEWARGFIVTCVERNDGRTGPAWSVSPRLVAPDGRSPDGILDRILRPIGKPSDDATDETLLWTLSPTWAKAYGVEPA